MKKILAIALLITMSAQANLIEVTSKAQFNKLANEGKPMCIIFYTQWCQFCTKRKPEMEALANEYTQKGAIVAIADFDNAEIKPIAVQLGVQSVPCTYIIDRQSKPVHSVVSYIEPKIREELNKVI